MKELNPTALVLDAGDHTHAHKHFTRKPAPSSPRTESFYNKPVSITTLLMKLAPKTKQKT